MDVIFAEATPSGRGGVSIVRVSGSSACILVEKLTGTLPPARCAGLRDVMDGHTVLDRALVIWFEDGRSFTGEEVVELHLHGAPVIVRRVLDLLRQHGARPAEAGEFTRRAFLNGRMDLSEVEGLADLLDAETEAQRRLAMRMANGELGHKVSEWRNMLIRAGALIEVSVDFADEDVPDEVPPEVFDLLSDLRQQIGVQIKGYGAAERVRKGFEVAIIGPPNAGKSSLINKIARRDVALVSDIAGTTRDIIELRIDLKGLAITLLDTAGLRQSDDVVEVMGVARARARAEAADLRLHLSLDGTPDATLWRDGDILVGTKSDIGTTAGLPISALTGAGIEDLFDQVHAELSNRVADAGLISHERQLASLAEAYNALTGIENMPAEILAESARRTVSSLDRLLGRIGAEEYLDVIFSSFCIGK